MVYFFNNTCMEDPQESDKTVVLPTLLLGECVSKKWENWHHQEKGGKLHRLRMQNKIMRHVGTHRDMLWQHFKIGKERGPHPPESNSRSNFSLDFSRLLVSTLFYNIQMMYKTEGCSIGILVDSRAHFSNYGFSRVVRTTKWGKTRTPYIQQFMRT